VLFSWLRSTTEYDGRNFVFYLFTSPNFIAEDLVTGLLESEFSKDLSKMLFVDIFVSLRFCNLRNFGALAGGGRRGGITSPPDR
jgi:hypothetical protein